MAFFTDLRVNSNFFEILSQKTRADPARPDPATPYFAVVYAFWASLFLVLSGVHFWARITIRIRRFRDPKIHQGAIIAMERAASLANEASRDAEWQFDIAKTLGKLDV